MAREVLQIETILHKHMTTFTLVLHSNAKEKEMQECQTKKIRSSLLEAVTIIKCLLHKEKGI